MMDLLPLALWVLSSVWSGVVCAVCVHRSRLFSSDARSNDGRRPEVEPVGWGVIYAQVASVVLCAVPFMALILMQHDIDPAVLAAYERYQLFAAAVSIMLVAAEWVAMFIQSKRAERTQMDRVLRRRQTGR